MSSTTCGYGSSGNTRTANSGYFCPVNTALSLWNFCTTTATAFSDCGMAGYCIDQYACSRGCGPYPNNAAITTYTCGLDYRCSTVVSDNLNGGSYLYIACGSSAITETLFPTPPRTSASTTTTSSSSSSSSSRTPSSSSSSSSPPTTNPTTAIISPSRPSSNLFPAGATSPVRSSTPATGSHHSHVGAIAGGVVGGVVGGAAVICLIILAIISTRRKRKSDPQTSTPPRSEEDKVLFGRQQPEEIVVHELSNTPRQSQARFQASPSSQGVHEISNVERNHVGNTGDQ